MDFKEVYKNMSSQENTMDTEENENWVEQHLAATTEWGTGRMGRKERWDVNKAREASELEALSLDTTTEAIEPREEIEWGTPTLPVHSMDKGESFPGAYSSPSHLPRYSMSKEHSMMVQQVVGGMEMHSAVKYQEGTFMKPYLNSLTYFLLQIYNSEAGPQLS